MSGEEIKKVALRHAVHNAVTHEGKAQSGPVVGRIMAGFIERRGKAKEVNDIVSRIVSEVNSWSREKQVTVLKEKWPELLESKKNIEKVKTLPPLQNVKRFEIVRTRFAPNPDGALHLGSAEPIIFCDEYAKRYKGKFILRFEDTSPDVKTPLNEIYKWIEMDLEWLGVKVDEKYVQSDRINIYYKYAVRLLERCSAYICTCTSSAFKEIYMAKKACPCRSNSIEVNLKRWMKMKDGTYAKGDAVVRIKTDLEHPNPAVRDWPALRIAESAHPRQGNKFRVWPLYNFSCAIDDHEMKVSHIIRGKEHEVNTTRQRYLSDHLGWEFPEIINIGRLGLEVGVLSKSKIRSGIEDGSFTGWDDPRVGTLRSLKRRGLQPEAIREVMIQIGPKPINSTLSWDHLASVNRKLVDPRARRFTFVRDPVNLKVTGIPDEHKVRLPSHPDHPEWGSRDYLVKPEKGESIFIISNKDAKMMRSDVFARLMGLFNIETTHFGSDKIQARFHSKSHQEARKFDFPFVHWLPLGVGIKAQVVMPDASTAQGLAETGCSNLEVDSMIQFERYGFVRVDSKSPFVAYYAHR